MINIYVGNLSFKTTEPELQALFEAHGAVQRASVVVDKQTGRPRGFAFVEMPDDAQAKAAIEALNNKEFQGRVLTVNEAKPREPRNERGPRN